MTSSAGRSSWPGPCTGPTGTCSVAPWSPPANEMPRWSRKQPCRADPAPAPNHDNRKRSPAGEEVAGVADQHLLDLVLGHAALAQAGQHEAHHEWSRLPGGNG